MGGKKKVNWALLTKVGDDDRSRMERKRMESAGVCCCRDALMQAEQKRMGKTKGQRDWI